MFSSRSVQIAAVFSDVFGQALPNLCRSFYNETKAEMFFSVFAVALLAEGVDRNSTARGLSSPRPWSPSSRRAWIEISVRPGHALDRRVALLAEGVDRNTPLFVTSRPRAVALLAEGVDRNIVQSSNLGQRPRSPSSRRAWIEISPTGTSGYHQRVALLAEGVDRNNS